MLPEIIDMEKDDSIEEAVGKEKESNASSSESTLSPEKVELPKSKGQLRLVPFESLLSPSYVHVDAEEEKEKAKFPQTRPISQPKPNQRVMVAIPEQNLAELNITAPQPVASRSTHQPTQTESCR